MSKNTDFLKFLERMRRLVKFLTEPFSISQLSTGRVVHITRKYRRFSKSLLALTKKPGGGIIFRDLDV